MPPSKNQTSVATKIQCVLNTPNSTVSYSYIYGVVYWLLFSSFQPNTWQEAIEGQRDLFWLKVCRDPVCYEWKGMVAGSCVATEAQTKTTQILTHLSGTWSRRTQEVGHGYRPQGQPAVVHLLQLYPTSSNHTWTGDQAFKYMGQWGTSCTQIRAVHPSWYDG